MGGKVSSDSEVIEESAITWRTISALVFAAAVVQPLIIYLTLVGSPGLIELSLIGWGGGFGLGYSVAIFTALGSQILWLVVILWTWISRMFGRELSLKETFMIYAFYPSTVGTSMLFLIPIFRLYVANSIIVEELGLAAHIPEWWAPRGVDAEIVYRARGFFVRPMLLPVLIPLAVTILTYVCDLSLGLFAYQRYAVEEKLDFPAASSYARGLMIISGAEKRGSNILMSAAAIGIAYGILSWLLPSLTGIKVLQLLPRGITDFTYLIEGKFPGASFGIDFTLGLLVSGFVVPLKVLATMAITGIAAYTIGNHYLVKYGIWPDWAPQYGLGWNFARSQLYWWTSVTIGLALAAALVPLALHPKEVVRLFTFPIGSSAGVRSGATRGYLFLCIFLASSLISVLIFHLLIPGFPILLAILFVVGWSFFATMASAQASGVTFRGFWVPYAKESMIYYSGYSAPEAWFGKDFLMFSQGGSAHAASLKMAAMCGVKISDYIKGFLIASTIGMAFGFIYVSLFWKTAPIPSYVYQFTLTGWPIMALEMSRWTKWLWTGVIFKTNVILASIAIGAAIVTVTELLGAPWVLISIVTGLNTLPSVSIIQLIGGVVGFFLSRRLGRERWREIAPIIVVGVLLGDGVVIALGSALSIVFGSVWSLPY